MKKQMMAVLACGVIALAGCQGGAATKSGGPELTMEAQVALMQAEQDVKLANQKAKDKAGAANKALEMAKAAADKGDSAGTQKHAEAATKEAMQAMK